ncbi:MAG: Uma2 family endonuclease [Desulfobacterales bacterium]
MSPSVNHSYICTKIIEHLLKNEGIQPFIELTLDIDKGLTPDISVYKENTIQPDFLEDKTKCEVIPFLVIEILSPQGILELVEKAKTLLAAGVSAVWIVDIYARTVIVMSSQKKETFHREVVACEGIKVDFKSVFI